MTPDDKQRATEQYQHEMLENGITIDFFLECVQLSNDLSHRERLQRALCGIGTDNQDDRETGQSIVSLFWDGFDEIAETRALLTREERERDRKLEAAAMAYRLPALVAPQAE